MKGFRLWNEQTSTSPMGSNLGLYKMWFAQAKTKNEEEDNDDVDKMEFFSMITKIVQKALHLMTPLEKWKTIHNIFILKETGNYKISCQRMLHKLDAELNMLQRDFHAYKMIHDMKQHNMLEDTQYGGRQGRTSINPVLIKVLTLETAYIQQSNMAITDCNAKACCNCIILAICTLMESKAGLPKQVNILCARTLEQMRYHPVIGKGIAAQYNQHEEEKLALDSGQGAADSPARWGAPAT